ncbi:MAG TPA: hypothetical protein VHF69_10845, partial [Candidatus Synoicihabitans sp.]|nr:hypothetical protein [Candidatus Synoicihabitans sp.]
MGTADGAMLPDGQGGLVKDERGAVVLSRLNPSTLEELARRTNGVYRDASSWVELAQLLRETVEAGREGQFTETSKVRQVERFQWLLAPALLLLIWSFWQEFPVHPRHRSMKLAPTPPSSPSPSASRPTPTTAAGQVAAIALSLAATFATSSRASAQADGNPFAGPLSQVVGRLVGQPNLAAKDYAELAQATITYGERMSGAQQQAEPGAIDDALQAVDAGRALDPKAADWDQLKQKLEALRPPEQQQPQQQQQTESEKDQSDSSEQDQQGQGEPPQDQSGQSKDQQNQERDRQNTDSEANENEQSQQSPPQEQSSDRSAFGEMEQPPPEGGEESDEPPPDTQKVGGQSERRMEE